MSNCFDLNKASKTIEKTLSHYRNAYYGLLSNEDFEDIKQEAFLRIWKNKDTYTTTMSKLSTWVAVITRNCFFDMCKTKKKHVETYARFDDLQYNDLQMDSDDVSTFGTWATDEEFTSYGELHDVDHIMDCIGGLTKNQQEVIEMLMNGLKPGEIAEELGISNRNAYVMIHRSKKALKESLYGKEIPCCYERVAA